MHIRLTVAILMLAGSASGQGDYAPVTAADVPKLKLNHYHTADQKGGRLADFEWTFTKTEFTVRKGKGPIPAHLTDMLLPAGTTGDAITGKWKLTPGSELELSEIKCGDKAGKPGVKLRAFKTAPTVVRISDPTQFVFGIGN